VETSSGMTLYHSGNQLWYDTISQWKPALVWHYITVETSSGIIHFCWFDTISQWKPALVWHYITVETSWLWYHTFLLIWHYIMDWKLTFFCWLGILDRLLHRPCVSLVYIWLQIF